MHGSKDEVIARVENFLICKAAFEKALFVYPDAHFGDAPRGEDHFEVEGEHVLLARKEKPQGGYPWGEVRDLRIRKILRDISHANRFYLKATHSDVLTPLKPRR